MQIHKKNTFAASCQHMCPRNTHGISLAQIGACRQVSKTLHAHHVLKNDGTSYLYHHSPLRACPNTKHRNWATTSSNNKVLSFAQPPRDHLYQPLLSPDANHPAANDSASPPLPTWLPP